MSPDEAQLRVMLVEAVPALPQPPDRVAAVRARVRWGRRRAMAAGFAVVAVLAGGPVVAVALDHRGSATVSSGGRVTLRTAGCATQTSPPALTVNGTPQPANQNDLVGVASAVQSEAQTRFADVYTGVEIVPNDNLVLVHRKPSPVFDAWLRDEFADRCVEAADSRYSAIEAKAMMDRLVNDRPYWQTRGIEIRDVRVNADGTIWVGVPSSVLDRARREIPSHYGFAIVVQEQQQRPSVG